MALYVIGYPLGGVIGGMVAQQWLLVQYDWRAVFMFGAVVTAALIPLVWLLVPETPAFFAAVRPANAVDKINRSLKAFGKPTITQLPALSPTAPKPKVTDILSNPKLRPVTLLLAFGYMFHTITFYYILKWAVQVVHDFPPGYSQPDAASVLTYANVGGALGGFLFGFLMKKWHIKWPTILMLLIGSAMVISFGLGRGSLSAWQWATALCGFCTNAAIVGYYAGICNGLSGACTCHRHGLRAGHRTPGCRGFADSRRRAVRSFRQERALHGFRHHGDGFHRFGGAVLPAADP